MLLKVSVPLFADAAIVRLRNWHVAPGDALAAGATLVDLTVDLAGGIAQDCPPVSVCRIVVREACRVDRLRHQDGAELATGTVLALLAVGDAADGAPAREARVTVATVLDHADWWSG